MRRGKSKNGERRGEFFTNSQALSTQCKISHNLRHLFVLFFLFFLNSSSTFKSEHLQFFALFFFQNKQINELKISFLHQYIV